MAEIPDTDYAPSALPPTGARIAAFASILVAGLCGGLIGYAFIDLQTDGDDTVLAGIAGLVGAVIFAVGVGVVAVLALRAMGEWRTIEHGKAADRPFVNQAEDARGVSLLGRLRGDDRPPPAELDGPSTEPQAPEALRQPEA